MHTLKVILTGIALLGICLTVGRFCDAQKGMLIASMVFIPLWLLGSIANLYFGVTKAGYSISDELPVLLIVFAVPTAIAIALRIMLVR